VILVSGELSTKCFSLFANAFVGSIDFRCGEYIELKANVINTSI